MRWKTRFCGRVWICRYKSNGHHRVSIIGGISPVSGHSDERLEVLTCTQLEFGQHPWDIPTLGLDGDILDPFPWPPGLRRFIKHELGRLDLSGMTVADGIVPGCHHVPVQCGQI